MQGVCFESLLTEIFYPISSNLTLKELATFSQVNKKCHEAVIQTLSAIAEEKSIENVEATMLRLTLAHLQFSWDHWKKIEAVVLKTDHFADKKLTSKDLLHILLASSYPTLVEIFFCPKYYQRNEQFPFAELDGLVKIFFTRKEAKKKELRSIQSYFKKNYPMNTTKGIQARSEIRIACITAQFFVLIPLLLDSRGGEKKPSTNLVPCPLNAAVMQNDRDEALRLIEKGNDLNLRCAGRTALHRAVIQNDLEIVKHLLAYGAYVNIKSNEGYTPINDGIVFLIELFAKNLKEEDLTLAVENKIKILALLVFYGGDIDQTNNTGDTPLHLAIKMRSIRLVIHLCTLGADLNKRNQADRTPLGLAGNLKFTEIVNILLNTLKLHERSETRTLSYLVNQILQ